MIAGRMPPSIRRWVKPVIAAVSLLYAGIQAVFAIFVMSLKDVSWP